VSTSQDVPDSRGDILARRIGKVVLTIVAVFLLAVGGCFLVVSRC
jgi:hypothetical protein